MEEIISIIARELSLQPQQVRGTIGLLQDGATVPFISRYRKEVTGNLDEVKIEAILERMEQLFELRHRKQYIASVIENRGSMTTDLQRRLNECWNPAEVEDIYLPFKPKRKTRAEAARQKGLEPLAKIIFAQRGDAVDVAPFLSNEVADENEATAGAADIIAAWVNEDSRARSSLRMSFERTATLRCTLVKGKEKEAQKYRTYFDVKEPLRRVKAHRLLAMRRGESEGLLKVSISPASSSLERLKKLFVKGSSPSSKMVEKAVEDAYSRLLCPSIEREYAALSKREADLRSIEVFARALRSLLLAPPLGGRRLMAIDPGIRTGCKTVILDEAGDLLHYDTIFPHASRDKAVYAEMQVLKMLARYDVKTIAIGSGTAGRETREFIEELQPGDDVEIYMINEDGASVYSASEVARAEFPDHDVTVRGAVSIGRRLMDPLAELVKIPPRSLGVGQYQHDVDPSLLDAKLRAVTESCVNAVGVNLNTASAQLLSHVSGIGPALAASIVAYRSEHGPFSSRQELKKVPRLGPKAFTLSAGFLRIPGADNPLDNSAVHPERYDLVNRMASDMDASVAELLASATLRSRIDPAKYADQSAGMETLADILSELDKPGRDPRPRLQVFSFDPSISSIDDLEIGREYPGRVANVTDFGAFVDLGIKTKGLLHTSRQANPRQPLTVGQELMVRVISLDPERARIGLTDKPV